ncbi:hypothetical protein [Magnetofaba australis]|uniref:Uncharacterized protein n=1 Tax=Magnetofaba australis IT-1 TaxID=1434232 RepID=A0A1Y2K570_9PROT|nr:hypothetical protein [Magnetofaba australis]OSM04821.1 hypothetical protein MAIT1_02916 [Magnetofaba australis IT-1]
MSDKEQKEMLLKFVVEFDKRFTAIEEEIVELKTKLEEMGSQGAANPEEWDKLNRNLKDVSESLVRANKHQGQLEKRVEVVKNDSSSGLVVSVAIFTILFIISLFIRA